MIKVTSKAGERPADTAPRIPRPSAAPPVQPAKRARQASPEPAAQGPAAAAARQPAQPLQAAPLQEASVDLAGLLGAPLLAD